MPTSSIGVFGTYTMSSGCRKIVLFSLQNSGRASSVQASWRFCFASQMSQGRRETAIGRRKSPILTESLLGRGNRVVETTETDECDAHSCKPHE